MVEERLTDGVRIAQLLASEVEGGVGVLDACRVSDADPDVEPTPDGALAYRITVEEGGTDDTDATDVETPARDLLAEVFVQPDRARVEFLASPDRAADAADSEGLRVRPKAVRPPRTLVFLPDGASVKRLLPVFDAVLGGARDE
ncbi:hypothetical protein [Salinirubrum litoreum]|uniref:DUF7993 domain-containing protein n=1 Tax=Salinirubrum litoreum TaxID=1126234 RepID=A0ABD5RAI8_9EURY|nr:hypothetical protein [Salinirubrum litoreum]